MAKTKDGAAIGAKIRLPAAAGNNIRNWRLFLKIPEQADLAALTVKVDPNGKGLDRPCIVRLESGTARYNESHLAILSRAMGVSPRDLIGTNPFDSGDIFAVYAGLTAAKKRRLIRLAVALK